VKSSPRVGIRGRKMRREREREKLKKWLRMVEDELPGSGAENLILRCFDRVGDRKELSKDLEPY
jgi:Ribonuclease G/E